MHLHFFSFMPIRLIVSYVHDLAYSRLNETIFLHIFGYLYFVFLEISQIPSVIYLIIVFMTCLFSDYVVNIILILSI